LYLRDRRRGECYDDCSDYELEHFSLSNGAECTAK
jgi:hypothetical protein